MIIKKMAKTLKTLILVIFFSVIFKYTVIAEDQFSQWVSNFKKRAVNEGVSEATINLALSNVKFLPQVIKFDRYQPEFYEDTKTYVNKRTSSQKVKKGINLYNFEKEIINEIEKKFLVEKELLLALMGIETNYGKYLGKMDIISSLATLSFDQRRSEFFTEELIIVLKLIDKKIINKDILFGSWAGAFGNFQFMPSTIQSYAIDYNNNTKIELKKLMTLLHLLLIILKRLDGKK